MTPYLVVIGSLNMDLVTEAERFPSKGETLLGNKFSQIRGGKGANQAVAAARLGASVSMIGSIGHDAFGQSLREGLIAEKIDVQGVQTVSTTTGIAQITIADHDNSIIVVPGANYQCTPEWIVENEQIISAADILLIQLEIPLTTVKQALDLAQKHNIPVILNPAPAQGLAPDLLEKVTYLTPNQTELALLGKVDLQDELAEQRALERILKAGIPYVIVTKGEQGALIASRESGQLRAVPSFSVPVVDTTGAGDAFNAGLAVALAEGEELIEAVSFASAVAGLAVSKYGAQPGMPLREEVEHFLRGVNHDGSFSRDEGNN